jgi:hypothetical protein
VSTRVAAYTTNEPGTESELLTTTYNAELLLVTAPEDLLEHPMLPDELTTVLEQTPCDVAFLAGRVPMGSSGPIMTPFGGADHDWSAIELAAWLARSLETSLRLVGTEADNTRGRRDASRLLARASLLVQQLVGIVTEPVLASPGENGVLQAAAGARLLVVGLSSHWRAEGIGATRLAVASGAPVSTLFVRRGLRPGGIAPSETLSRFTWTLASR